MTLPRRIQLVKLLRANGLRDVERLRADELREVLHRLRAPLASAAPVPSSAAFVARPMEAVPPIVDESDDPCAAPRFREPKLFLPDHERTFLRAIPVKARLLFCTWDVRADVRSSLQGQAQLHLFWREFLGEPPEAHELLTQELAALVDVELSSPGWYVTVPGERLALAAALVVVVPGQGAKRIIESNLCITPPARPAPAGPLWLATLPPSLDRRRLAARTVFGLEESKLRRVGEAVALALDVEDEDSPPSSATLQTAVMQAAGGRGEP
jgi:hypothetical protein